jgi:glyoxylase-like metal-dependent hydrolase (beta-lactamase superfamily II)/rhodanese-related sulfurtransferase
MYIEQIYTNCLSESAYYIEDEGEVAIIDPLRDIDIYIEKARERSAQIKYIFETHFHADFVSGHLDLQRASGAPIIYGPQTICGFDAHIANDGDIFSLGRLKIKVLHTPGHTLESSCYLLRDADDKDVAVFTGDTLFVGDVGRPDLAQKSGELTMFDLAGMLYQSLQEKILPLADDVIVYPAHGPGSSCGKNLGPATFSSIGEEKRSNYALKAETKENFIKSVTEGLAVPPQYFPINASINKQGYESLSTILKEGLRMLSVDELKEKIKQDIILLDTRKATEFTHGFVPGSISIGLEGRFAEWAGCLLPFNKTIYLITDKGKEEEAIIRLARVGFDKIGGCLAGGFESWKMSGEPLDMIVDIEPYELSLDLKFDEKLFVLDVRKDAEYADGHVAGATNIPLSRLIDPGTVAELDEADNIYIHCAGGYRSVIAASIIKSHGLHNVHNILNGWSAIKDLDGIKIEKTKAALN